MSGQQRRTRPTGARMRAGENAAKIAALLTDGQYQSLTTVLLYRTRTTGTASGLLRSDVPIGYVTYLEDGPDEFAVLDLRGHRCATLRRVAQETGRTEQPGRRGHTVVTIHARDAWLATDTVSECPRGRLGVFDSVPDAVLVATGVQV